MSDRLAAVPGALVRVEERPDGVATVRLKHPPLNALWTAFGAVAAIPRPALAAIGGIALGGGLELASARDLHIAAASGAGNARRGLVIHE